MNVFIVGAAGAIGAALLERYLQNPMIERIVATHHLPMRSTHDKLQWLTCDLRDEQAIAACAEQIAAIELPIHRWGVCQRVSTRPLGRARKIHAQHS